MICAFYRKNQVLAILTSLSHDLIVAVKVTAYLVETIVLIGGEERKRTD